MNKFFGKMAFIGLTLIMSASTAFAGETTPKPEAASVLSAGVPSAADVFNGANPNDRFSVRVSGEGGAGSAILQEQKN